MDLFESTRLRVDRAHARSQEMIEAWNEYIEPHPFEFEVIRTGPSVRILRFNQVLPFPIELSALFGEWLYNLRTALDHLMWATAAHASGTVPPVGESGIQFPIYDDVDAWNRNLWRLKPLKDHQREILLTMQPFNSDADANYLGWINRLARIDRHRRLTEWTARIAKADPIIAVPGDAPPTLEWGQRVFVDRRCDLARVTFRDEESAKSAKINPRVGIDPEIAEWGHSPFWKRFPFTERLNMMMVFIKLAIDIHEFDCTGSPAFRKSVTEQFASESDARRAMGIFPPLSTPAPEPITWTAAEGKQRSADHFRPHELPTGAEGELSWRNMDRIKERTPRDFSDC